MRRSGPGSATVSEDFRDEIETALAGDAPVPGPAYATWTTRGDLASRARAYALSAAGWSRIRPEPSMEAQCDFMACYLLDCIAADPPPDGFVHGGFEAAYELAAWLKHLAAMPVASHVVADVAARLASLYRVGEPAVRTRIETGALEHALESAAVRPFFESWSADPLLAKAHRPALAWGLAHSDGTG